MPELPEVQTVVTTLQCLTGRRIESVRLFRTDIVVPSNANLPEILQGRSIQSIHRRAKRIVFTLDNAKVFFIHLGMTGRLTLEQPDHPLLPHTHLILNFDSQNPNHELRFRDPRRFGGIHILPPDVSSDDNLGPEPLTLRPAQLADRLAKTHRPIKSALLDQRLIAGLGNIYVDESLHRAGIHPRAFTDRLNVAQIDRLTQSIKQVLKRAIASRGSSLRDYVDANGNAGAFQKLHKVYDREGEPCATCKTPIERIVLTGRSTHFCPKCQPRKPPARKALAKQRVPR
jgi:formamidopyrimidine-DNA glycosylase